MKLTPFNKALPPCGLAILVFYTSPGDEGKTWCYIETGHCEPEGFGTAFYNTAGEKASDFKHIDLLSCGAWISILEITKEAISQGFTPVLSSPNVKELSFDRWEETLAVKGDFTIFPV